MNNEKTHFEEIVKENFAEYLNKQNIDENEMLKEAIMNIKSLENNIYNFNNVLYNNEKMNFNEFQ
jgi:hypothetical protein